MFKTIPLRSRSKPSSTNRGIGGFGGFPSGHIVAAFSVATVFANRYRAHRWVPWVAYGLAGGLSRLNAPHFPSGIFFGAALGYSGKPLCRVTAVTVTLITVIRTDE